MQPNDEPFREDTLDAQLDALAHNEGQAPHTSTSRAYLQLTMLYAAQASEEAQATERVRERLASHAAASLGSSASAASGLRTRELPSALPAPSPRALPSPRLTSHPSRSRRAALLRGVALALVVVIIAGGFVALRLGSFNSPVTNSYHWTTIPSPNTTRAVNELTGITMRTATDGWAWGYATDAPSNLNSNPISAPLVEHWDGKRWSIVPTPAMPYGGELTDIVSLAPDDAWAVGDQLITPTWSQNTTGGAVIEHWDGKRWTMIPANIHTKYNTDDTSLTKLAALSPNDIWAIGTYSGATNSGVIVHWDGTQWQEVAHPMSSGSTAFGGITAVAPNDIWVVGPPTGAAGSAVFERWDGVQWRLVPAPDAPLSRIFINSVTAVSTTDVWAVGLQDTFAPLKNIFTKPLTEHWDGKRWSIVSSPWPQNARLASVAALGPDDVWAVGIQEVNGIDVEQVGQGLVEHWDGQQWSLVTNPNPQSYTALRGVAADPSTPGKVWVVGTTGPAKSSGDQPSDARTFIEVGQP